MEIEWSVNQEKFNRRAGNIFINLDTLCRFSTTIGCAFISLTDDLMTANTYNYKDPLHEAVFYFEKSFAILEIYLIQISSKQSWRVDNIDELRIEISYHML